MQELIDSRYKYLNEILSGILKYESTKILEDITSNPGYRRFYSSVNDGKIHLSYFLNKQTHFARLDTFHNDVAIIDWVYSNGLQRLVKIEFKALHVDDGKKASRIDDSYRLVLNDLQEWTDAKADQELHDEDLSGQPLTDVFVGQRPDLQIVHGSVDSSTKDDASASLILTLGDQEFLIFRPTEPIHLRSFLVSPKRITLRLSTSLANRLGEILFNSGLDKLLSIETQTIVDQPIPIKLTNPSELAALPDDLKHIDFTGAYGVYFQELFFHIPFLIAKHLNANQKFKEAKWWYERIFDPTASDPPGDAMPTDRNWRYVEFRGVTLEKMQDMLTNGAAIEAYKNDPFNPYAIARLREGAFQKTVVMKYIDNLLDWGDHLFAQDTMESINEATMLYVLAADILGKRPAKLGKCNAVDDTALTYERIGSAITQGSEFLAILESWHLKINGAAQGMAVSHPRNTPLTPALDFPILTMIAQRHPAFCIPANMDLIQCWDRVEDRLFKIRHCMNVRGVRRQLALFQPPIDPMALVRARAAGLSLEDILSALAATPPPYRFTYLIEKAKQYTQTVQSFGNTLLSALEKKDVEELTLLRSVHERNILRMTTAVKKQQMAEAKHQYQAMVETRTNVENRIAYYQGLIEAGLTGWEVTQQTTKHAGTVLLAAETALRLTASISYLLPQVGSPFAMKYGGKEIGDSQFAYSELIANLSRISDSISASAGLEATFQRREQEWNQQLSLANQELKQVEQQLLAAEIRQLIAEKDLEIHEKNKEQVDELHEFYKDKFSSLGLYNDLSTTLNRLYREAYSMAYDMAMLTQRAYQFERDDATPFITGDNWQFDRAGLLAGERLLLQLQQMEKAYIEQHTRDQDEVTASFSLALLSPQQLHTLRDTGTCEFALPESAFDLVYPGQFRRIIKAVRLSIPCIVGPYTNVSARLTLLRSELRENPNNDPKPLPTHQSSIAISNAQNDSGMFEFSFRDERYLPFEGGGAVNSVWKLELPGKRLNDKTIQGIRLFDYNTIADVLIHISYTARYDGQLRDNVEAAISDKLNELAASSGLFRMFSLRLEFPNIFHQLSSVSTNAIITISTKHFPYYISSIPSKKLVVEPKANTYHIFIDPEHLPSEQQVDIKPVPGSTTEWLIDSRIEPIDPSLHKDVVVLVKYRIV